MESAREPRHESTLVTPNNRPRADTASQLIGALTLLAITVLLVHESGLNPDVAFFTEVARRTAAGAPLYRDAPGSFVEVNPPLVVWSLLPTIWLARRLGLLVSTAPVLLVAVETVISSALSFALTRRAPRPARSLPWLVAIGGLVLAIHDFAQREHQVVLLLAPSLVSLALVSRGEEHARWLRIAVGFCAGLGLSLKPHFVLAWAVAELVMAALDGRPRQLLRLENVVAGGVAALYALAVVLWVPEYLQMMRIWGPLYLEMSRKPLVEMLSGPESIATIAVLLLALRVAGTEVSRRPGRVFAIAATTFLGAVLIQHKGFAYHYFPAFAFSCVSLLLSVSEFRRERQPPLSRLLLGIASALILYITGMRVIAGVLLGRENARLTRAYSRLIDPAGANSGAAPQDLLVLSTNLVHAFPMVVNMGQPWPIRFPSLWALETTSPIGCKPAREQDVQIERRFADDLLEDLERAAPSVIVVAPLPSSMHPHSGCATVIDHLSRRPRFAELFARYAPIDTIPRGVHGPFLVLRRK